MGDAGQERSARPGWSGTWDGDGTGSATHPPSFKITCIVRDTGRLCSPCIAPWIRWRGHRTMIRALCSASARPSCMHTGTLGRHSHLGYSSHSRSHSRSRSRLHSHSHSHSHSGLRLPPLPTTHPASRLRTGALRCTPPIGSAAERRLIRIGRELASGEPYH
jgi:hypothetical protein